MKSTAKVLIFVIIILSTLNSCDEKIPVPQVPVDFTIDLNNTQYRDLTGVGNVLLVLGGSRGIIIKRISYEDFTAFDQHCPYDPENSLARVAPDAGSTDFASCPTCKSRYNLYFGNVESGPGKYPLQDYKTAFYPSSNLLRVYNNF
jgi:hypothetical protein